VGFAGDRGQAAAREPVEQFLEVADAGFDGGAAAGVELGALGVRSRWSIASPLIAPANDPDAST
jgi:hypothetical protein